MVCSRETPPTFILYFLIPAPCRSLSESSPFKMTSSRRVRTCLITIGARALSTTSQMLMFYGVSCLRVSITIFIDGPKLPMVCGLIKNGSSDCRTSTFSVIWISQRLKLLLGLQMFRLSSSDFLAYPSIDSALNALIGSKSPNT